MLVLGTVARFSACPVQLISTIHIQGKDADVSADKENAYSVLNKTLCHILPTISSGTCTSANGTTATITEASNFTSHTDAVNPASSFSKVQLQICLSSAVSREATEADVQALSNSTAIELKLRDLDSGVPTKWGEAPVVSVEEAGVSCAQCAHCPKATHAMQGSRCSQCQDGNQPGGDNLSCRACPTGHAGTRGTCARCTGKWVPNPQRTACDKKRPVWKEDWFVYLIAASLAVAAIAYVFRKMCRRIANKQSPEPEPVIPASSGKEMVAREMRNKDKDRQEKENEASAGGEHPAAAYKL